MSKEIAQTVGGKRVAWLIAIVAAFAVFATLSTQFQKSDAALIVGAPTLVQAPASGIVPGGSVVTFTATVQVSATANAGTLVVNLPAGYTISSTVASGSQVGGTTGNVPPGTCTLGGTTTTAGTFICTVTTTVQNTAGVLAGATATATDSGSASSAATAGVTVAAVTGTVTPGAAGGTASVTFSLPAGITYCSDGPGGPRAFTAPDQTITGLTEVSTTPDTNATTSVGSHTVVFSDTGAAGGSVVLSTHLAIDIAGAGCSDTTVAVTAAAFAIPELRHIVDGASPANVYAGREINNNVRGSRHTVCTVAQNTGIDLNLDGDFTGLNESAPVAVQLPVSINLANLVFTPGGGYLQNDALSPTVTDVRIFIGDGTQTGQVNSTVTAGLAGATCISWISLEAGDQSLSILYTGLDSLNYSASWDSDGDANDADGIANDGTPNTTLVKEWNRLEDSALTVGGTTVAGNQSTALITRNIAVTLNPATGLYQFSPVSISDIFRGSHFNTAETKEGPLALAGVNFTAVRTGCGDTDLPPSGVTTLSNVGSRFGSTASFLGFGPSATASSVSGSFFPGLSVSDNCGPGRTARITITGSEPGPLGSGEGITVTQIVDFTFTINVAEKQVFLAWAGQRIILEHDWRIPAGDFDGGESPNPSPFGECPFSGSSVAVTHIKGSGPGNFLPGQGTSVNGSDQATVFMDASDNSQTDGEDIIGNMNGMCISRVLYESEDQGQVDIEGFVDVGGPINATKVAWVIYYMKINTIDVSLVTQVAKPSHNSSNRTTATANQAADSTHLADYAPGNPWDASKDDADNAAEWNVSKDLLVRGRVTGWFLNSNPSGRAADTSNPLNVLPANRWVMPQDWPLLAGGPADPADGTDAVGTAEQFRPYYDIMFAPNNTRGISLTSPEGANLTQVAVVVAVTGVTNTAGSFRVNTCADLALGIAAGTTVVVGTTSVSGAGCTGTTFTSTGLSAAPAAGTPLFLISGAPFEGPYSTLDIVGLASQGLGGAALSDFDPNNIRDTTLDDGDVDWWDAPMPAAPVSVSIRGTGFIKEVIKDEVYYLGTPNSIAQVYPNPYYIQDIPGSPFIPAVVAGGGYFWDTWAFDGPGGLGQRSYRFWTPAIIGTNSEGFGDGTVTAAQATELAAIRVAYGDVTIARDLVVYSDNHGEFMVTANGDFKTDLTACTTNLLAGGKHCKPGDKVGTGTITATVDYPDFRGKHFPVLSNAATVTWTWAGYKDVTVEAATGVDQFKYIVFHGLDRDGFCSTLATGAVLLHPLLSGAANDTFNGNPAETVDFLIDSGEGIIVGSAKGGVVNDGKQFATGVQTFSTAENDPAVTGILEFPLSSLAASGAVDECQAWIKVSNSLLGILNVLAIAHDDEGNIGFDKIIDLTNTTSYTLNFRWSLITWAGADAISVNDAIKGTGTSGSNPGGNDISASVTAIYGWDAAAQQWLGFFPSGVNVPGANDLVSLKTGQAYWIAITGPSSVTWTIASNVN